MVSTDFFIHVCIYPLCCSFVLFPPLQHLANISGHNGRDVWCSKIGTKCVIISIFFFIYQNVVLSLLALNICQLICLIISSLPFPCKNFLAKQHFLDQRPLSVLFSLPSFSFSDRYIFYIYNNNNNQALITHQLQSKSMPILVLKK